MHHHHFNFPLFIRGFTVRGWEKKCWLCLSLFWVCPKPMWSVVSYWFCAGGLLDSVEFSGYMHLFILHFRCFIFACIISSSWGKSNYKISSLSIIGRAWRKPFLFFILSHWIRFAAHKFLKKHLGHHSNKCSHVKMRPELQTSFVLSGNVNKGQEEQMFLKRVHKMILNQSKDANGPFRGSIR